MATKVSILKSFNHDAELEMLIGKNQLPKVLEHYLEINLLSYSNSTKSIEIYCQRWSSLIASVLENTASAKFILLYYCY